MSSRRPWSVAEFKSGLLEVIHTSSHGIGDYKIEVCQNVSFLAV